MTARGARLALVALAVVGAWFLFPSLRRVEIEVRFAEQPGACAERVHVRIGREGRVDYGLRQALGGPSLPPWRLRLTPGEYQLGGDWACEDGSVVPLGPRRVNFEAEGAITLRPPPDCPCGAQARAE